MIGRTPVTPKLLETVYQLAEDNALCDIVLPFEQVTLPWHFTIIIITVILRVLVNC